MQGGHQLNDANDLLWRDGGYKWFQGKRINNPNTHGTGCTLSSAIASNLAKGFDLDTSVERAKKYISGALAAMLDLGKGSGPMNHGFAIQNEFTLAKEDTNMTEKRTSIFENGLIWFGAGVSLAEILTGTYFAPLGFQKRASCHYYRTSYRLHHAFPCRRDRRQNAPQCYGNCKNELRGKGGIFFSFLNVLQLVGWTAIMIYDGALAADGVLHTGSWVWCLVIGALIVLWIFTVSPTWEKSTPSQWRLCLFSHWCFAS